jgi:predicted transcriptional regulator
MSELVNRQIALLAEVTDRFRREEARSLGGEGMKPEEIADIFGVTLTHVEAMLSDRSTP